MGPHPKVAILMCTHNSERFLHEQMESFFSQTHKEWELLVSDDGSGDRTRDTVLEYSGRGKAIRILDGPCRGAAANFLFLLRRADSGAEYFAWADADDVWLPDKLRRAVRRLEALGRERAALYCARTEVVDAENNPLYLSPLFGKPPCFRNALCQNIGGGNTMVLNRKAAELLRRGGEAEIHYHDWWAYMLVSGCGGSVVYDSGPCLRYRQHGGNLVGGNRSLGGVLSRALRLFRGGCKEWNRASINALEKRLEWLTPEARDALEAFKQASEAGSIWERTASFRRSGVFRQGTLENIALRLAVLLGAYP